MSSRESMSIMIFYPRPSAGSTVRVHPLLALSSLLLLHFPTAHAACTTDPNDTTVEQCLSTSPTKSEVPTIIIFCIVASAVFFLVVGSFLIYLRIRQKRELTRRNEHREKVWQFKDMQRSGLRPTLVADGKEKAGEPIQISHPALMSEAATTPRYPAKSFYW